MSELSLLKRNRLRLGWIISLAALVLLTACEQPTGSEEKTVETPVASVKTGSYDTIQYVTLTCATAGVAIYYTLDGSTPTTSSQVYAGPIVINATMTLKAIAVKSGMKNSGTLTEIYTITLSGPSQAAMPTASPGAGDFYEAQSVTLTTTAGVAIHYTLDGSTPTTASKLYTNPIVINATTTLKAIAVKSGLTDSPVLTAQYTFSKGPITAIIINSAGASLAPGETRQFTATVTYANGETDPSAGDIAWTVTGEENGAAISEQGLLTISDTAAVDTVFEIKARAITGNVESDAVTITVVELSPYEAMRSSDGKLYLTLAEAIADSKGSAEEPVEIAILKNIGAASHIYIIPADTHIQLVVATGSDFVITEPRNDYNMFDVNGGTLILGSDTAGGKLTLQGSVKRSISIRDKGTLIMNDNVVIRNFKYPVTVEASSYFTMRGGRIENTDSPDDGGGVLAWRGTFRMEGGVIANNSGRVGGGVAVTYGGTFIFKAGTIYGSDNPEYANSVHTWGFNALGTFGGGETLIYDDGSPISVTSTGGMRGLDTTLNLETDNPPNENNNGGGNTGGSIPDARFLGAWSASSTWSGGHWDSTITISADEIVMQTVYDGYNFSNKISGLTWTPYTLDNNDDSNHNGYRVTGASHEGSFKVFYLVLLDDNTFHGLHQMDGSSTAGNARWFEGHYVKSR